MQAFPLKQLVLDLFHTYEKILEIMLDKFLNLYYNIKVA